MISVIIPTLNEARNLPPLLTALRNERAEHEIVVVDGGSDDGTIDIALANDASLFQASPGRGAAVRAGSRGARGDILFFLHADSTFPAGGLQRIEEALSADPDVIGGNFRLMFDGGTRFSRLLTLSYARVRRLGFYYGDSGIFVRRSAYDALGGMRPIAVMEDFDFARRLERFGKTCCITEPALVTSSRRFEGRHPLKIVCALIILHILFWLGVSPDRLAEIYRRHRPRTNTAQPSP